MAEFGDKLKAIRFYYGLTQEELAGRLGVTKQVISKYEKGLTSPRLDTVAHFATALNLDLVFLIDESFSEREVVAALEGRSRSLSPTPPYAAKTSYHYSSEGLTEDDVDAIEEFIEFRRQRKKNEANGRAKE